MKDRNRKILRVIIVGLSYLITIAFTALAIDASSYEPMFMAVTAYLVGRIVSYDMRPDCKHCGR